MLGRTSPSDELMRALRVKVEPERNNMWVKPEPCSPGGCGHFVKEEERSGGPKAAGGALLKDLHLIYEGHVMKEEELAIGPEVWHQPAPPACGGHVVKEEMPIDPEVWPQPQPPALLTSQGLIYESTAVLDPSSHWHRTPSDGSLSCDNSKKTLPFENSFKHAGQGAEDLHLMYEGHMPNEELALRPEVWQRPQPPARTTYTKAYESTAVLEPTLHQHHTLSNGSLSCDNSKKTPSFENNSCKQIVKDPAGVVVESSSTQGTRRAEDLHLMYEGHVPKEELSIGPEVWQQPEPPALLTSKGLIYESTNALEPISHWHRYPSNGSLLCDNSKKTPSFENSCNNMVQSTNITHKQAMLRTFPCPICNEEFPDSVNLTAHFRVYHQSFECNICHEKFTERSSLTQHLLTHGEKPYTCDICNKKFLHKGDLKTHIRVHTGEKPYNCDICNKKFAQRGSVRKHKISKHSEKKPCVFCNICNMKFLWKSELTQHLRVHTGERPYKCDICYDAFARKSTLTRHLQGVHNGEKCFACNICDEKFAEKGSLKNHVLIHGGEKPYYIHHICQYCNKKFSKKSGLTIHLRIHTREKPHKCDICEKKFIKIQQLTKHLRVHSGEKPEPPPLLITRGLIYESTDVLQPTSHWHRHPTNGSLYNSKKTPPSENDSSKQIVKEKPLCEERRGDLEEDCSGTQLAQERARWAAEALHLTYEGHVPKEELAIGPEVWHLPEPPALLISEGLIYESTDALTPTSHWHRSHSDGSLSSNNFKNTPPSENISCKEKPLCEERRADSVGGAAAESSGTQHAQEHTGRGVEALHLMYEGHMPNEELAIRPEVWQQPQPPPLLPINKGLIYESTAVLEPTSHQHRTPSNVSLSCDNSTTTPSFGNSCNNIVQSTNITHEQAMIRPFPCHVCNEEFPDSVNLAAHFRVHHQSFACNICNEKFAGRSSLTQHLLTHGEKPYTCDICNKKFLHKGDLKTHIHSVHTGEKPYNCDICNKKFAQRGSVRTHKISKHSEKIPCVFCNICNMKFFWKSQLTQHLRVHTGERPYKCDICYDAFAMKCTLTRHLQSFHNGEKCFACNICDEKFAEKGSLKNHVLIHGGEKPYYIHHVCQYCNKKFSKKSFLTTHLRTHTGEKPYNCDICEKKFMRKPQLTSHLRVHSGEKPYSCEICGKKFRTLSALSMHLHVHGARKKKVTCDVCNKNFPHEASLMRHQLVHSGEKKFPCDMCEKKFSQKCTLTRHLSIHRGEKFTCNVCGKKFSQKGALTMHHRRVHSGEKST